VRRWRQTPCRASDARSCWVKGARAYHRRCAMCCRDARYGAYAQRATTRARRAVQIYHSVTFVMTMLSANAVLPPCLFAEYAQPATFCLQGSDMPPSRRYRHHCPRRAPSGWRCRDTTAQRHVCRAARHCHHYFATPLFHDCHASDMRERHRRFDAMQKISQQLMRRCLSPVLADALFIDAIMPFTRAPGSPFHRPQAASPLPRLCCRSHFIPYMRHVVHTRCRRLIAIRHAAVPPHASHSWRLRAIAHAAPSALRFVAALSASFAAISTCQ